MNKTHTHTHTKITRLIKVRLFYSISENVSPSVLTDQQKSFVTISINLSVDADLICVHT